MSNQAIITCDGLTKTFADGDHSVRVLNEVDFAVQPGERIAILGASGAGKSTLLHCLGGLDTPSAGVITVNGHNMANVSESRKSMLRNHYLGFIYQFHHLLPEFSALENVAMPLLIRGLSSKEATLKASALLEKVGLKSRVSHRLNALSGGERQRVAIARALVTEPACLLADEPTGNLDEETAEGVFSLMLSLNAEINTALVIVTHNIELANKLDRQCVLRDGQLEALR